MSSIEALLFSWEKHLRAEGKSRATVKAYGDGIRSFIKWCDPAGIDGLAKEDVVTFLAALMETGVHIFERCLFLEYFGHMVRLRSSMVAGS